jgi:hypothetical protein
VWKAAKEVAPRNFVQPLYRDLASGPGYDRDGFQILSDLVNLYMLSWLSGSNSLLLSVSTTEPTTAPVASVSSARL